MSQKLWRLPFPFYCDCLAMQIFGYNGSFAQIARWAQEILGYNNIIVHQSYKIMVNIDAINCIYGKGIALYIAFTAYLKQCYIEQHSEAYDSSVFITSV